MERKFTGIRRKILLYFLTVMMIAIAGFLALYQFSMKSTKEIVTESMENTISKINLGTYNSLHDAEEIAKVVARDSEIQKALRADLPSDEKEMYKQRVNLNTNLRYINRYTKDISGIFVVGENGVLLRSTIYSMEKEDYRGDDWYQEVQETQEPLWRFSDNGSFMIRDLEQYVLSICVSVIDRASYRFMGVVVVDVLMDDLAQISQEGMVFDGILMLVNEKGELLYSNKESGLDDGEYEALLELLATQENTPQMETFDCGSGRFLVSGMPLNIAGWWVIGMASENVVYKNQYSMRNIMFLIILICILASVCMALVATHGISGPILAIRSAMQRVEKGEMDAAVTVKSNDELGQLAHSFNGMVKKLDALIQSDHENQEKLRVAELKALQAQINPHFLYNTLDSINWLAREGQTDRLIRMVDSLSTFFRISLSKGRTFITVEEELKHVENYILIQKTRYEKWLDYEICVPQKLYGYQCLKMILQPLVENSIYHGIKEKGVRGLIRISGEETEDMLIFRVLDTGKGMTREKLKELQNMLIRGKDYDENSYGVINVQRRIQTYFGEAYGLYFSSEYGVKTEVTVKIPKRTYKGDKKYGMEDCDCRG